MAGPAILAARVVMDWTFVFLAVDHYLAARQYDRAIDLVRQIVRKDPKNRRARERLRDLESLEKRRARRIPVEIVALLRRDGKREGFPVRLIRVSSLGMHLISPEEVAKGERLSVEIPPAGSDAASLRLPCVGVWCRLDGSEIHAGIELGPLNRRQRMDLLERAIDGMLQTPAEPGP